MDNLLGAVDREGPRLRIINAYQRRSSKSKLYSYFDPANQVLIQERELAFLDAIASLGVSDLRNLRVLDVGCGDGFFLRQFVHWGFRPENLYGIDLLPHRVQTAQALCPAQVTVDLGDASSLPYPKEHFDIVVQATMLSSVLSHSLRMEIASEMQRVLNPGGAILSYDFFVNNPKNPDVRKLTRSELRTLFPGCVADVSRITLAPPLARCIAPYSRSACRILSALKMFCTHYLAIVRKV